MKKFLSFLIILLLILSFYYPVISYADYKQPAIINILAEDNIIVTKCKDDESTMYLWETLNKYTENEKLTAAIMGYFWRESFHMSVALPGWYGHLNGLLNEDRCTEFVQRIDAGLEDGSTKEDFITYARDHGGYGLGQWYSFLYLGSFYDYAQEWGTSIGDAEMQCAYTVWSLKEYWPYLYEEIIESDCQYYMAMQIGAYYDGSVEGCNFMGDMADIYYKKFHK